MVDEANAEIRHPTFAETFRFWLKLGFISFGGPAGQIAIMHQELVERKKWISNARFLHALNYCMLLPGPEAQQLAIYVGWLLHKMRGGILAGSLFVLPSAFILWTLSYIYMAYGNLPWIAAIFYGLKPTVTAIIASAVIRIGKKALKNEVMWTLAVLAFVAIYFFNAPFPLIVFSAGMVGLLGGKYWRDKFAIAPGHGGKNESVISDDDAPAPHTLPSLARAALVSVVSLGLWVLPIIFAGMFLGRSSTIYHEGIFFSKAAVVTFGGAYAVLPYVAQQAVENFHWLGAGQMMDGLGLAETTPGPLIMVLQFVGFLGGWNRHGSLSPLLAATLGAAITTWTTFVPCFLWIFLGGPYIEKLRGNARLTTALSAITAAIVGVILNLAVWFGSHVFFPKANVPDWFAIGLCLAAFIAMLRWKISVMPVVFAGALLGLLYRFVFQVG